MLQVLIHLKAPKFEINDRVRNFKYKNILVKVILKTGQEKYLLSTLFWKLIFGLIKIKYLNREKITQSYMKKICCGAYYKWIIIDTQTVIRESKYY